MAQVAGSPQGDEARDWAIWRERTVYRKTQLQIAEQFGIGQQRVSQILRWCREHLPEDDIAQMRAESLALFDELGQRALEIVDLTPAPVFVGKDGRIAYDEDDKVVRDYSGRLKAIAAALDVDRERRKLMGLDAAQKTESSGAVRFEIVGIDPADLS